MKTRIGFVSNSSSSSFILKIGKYKTTRDVAMAMVPSREWEDDEVLMQKLLSMKDFDRPLAFRTCNYDTYISKENDKFYVFTCHNHNFEEIWDSCIISYSGDDGYENERTIKYSNFYYWPEYDMEAMPASWEQLHNKGDAGDFCKDCLMEPMLDKQGNLICIKCNKIVWEKPDKE